MKRNQIEEVPIHQGDHTKEEMTPTEMTEAEVEIEIDHLTQELVVLTQEDPLDSQTSLLTVADKNTPGQVIQLESLEETFIVIDLMEITREEETLEITVDRKIEALIRESKGGLMITNPRAMVIEETQIEAQGLLLSITHQQGHSSKIEEKVQATLPETMMIEEADTHLDLTTLTEVVTEVVTEVATKEEVDSEVEETAATEVVSEAEVASEEEEAVDQMMMSLTITHLMRIKQDKLLSSLSSTCLMETLQVTKPQLRRTVVMLLTMLLRPILLVMVEISRILQTLTTNSLLSLHKVVARASQTTKACSVKCPSNQDLTLTKLNDEVKHLHSYL